MKKPRVALIAGAIGRPGEALLNRVLASGDYSEVVALAESPMWLGIGGLRLAAAHELDQIDDAFILVADSTDDGARSFYGRDAPFVQVHHENLLAIARAASDAGARKLVLISPAPAWQQLGDFHRGLGDGTELAIAQLPIDSLVVLRPLRSATRTARSLIERFTSLYLSIQMLMTPKTLPQLTSEQLAVAALQAMRTANDGITVLAADRMESLLGPAR